MGKPLKNAGLFLLGTSGGAMKLPSEHHLARLIMGLWEGNRRLHLLGTSPPAVYLQSWESTRGHNGFRKTPSKDEELGDKVIDQNLKQGDGEVEDFGPPAVFLFHAFAIREIPAQPTVDDEPQKPHREGRGEHACGVEFPSGFPKAAFGSPKREPPHHDKSGGGGSNP